MRSFKGVSSCTVDILGEQYIGMSSCHIEAVIMMELWPFKGLSALQAIIIPERVMVLLQQVVVFLERPLFLISRDVVQVSVFHDDNEAPMKDTSRNPKDRVSQRSMF